MSEPIPDNVPKAGRPSFLEGGLSPSGALSSRCSLGWQGSLGLGVFGAISLEALKDLFAIHPGDCIVSPRLKMFVEISSPSFAPDGGFFAGFSSQTLDHRKHRRIWQDSTLCSMYKLQ
jgi:hypothetical protein